MSENKNENKKKKKGFDIISTIIIIVCLIVFCVSAFNLGKIFREYKKADDEYDKLALMIPYYDDTSPEYVKPTEHEIDTQEYTEEETEEDDGYAEDDYTQAPEDGVTVEPPIVEIPPVIAPVFIDNVDWRALYDTMHGINNDYQGWIYINGTKINYPIVQGTDNDFYLGHTFYKEPVFSACLFVDYRIEGGLEAKNPIVYGHNMKNGSMFAGLKKFMKSDFRNTHPSFSVYTSTGAYEYQVFSVYTTSPISDTYRTSFADGEDFMNYVMMIKNRSDVKYPVDVYPQDKIITLSTCVNNNKDRYIVHAKRIG
ncbi:MAG: class B sortase [Lachnospiraceae bacterium]|nr:class B sortase [Lachnospiraceae bacterium]